MDQYPVSRPTQKRNHGVEKFNISTQLSSYFGRLLKMHRALAIVQSIFDEKQVWADQCEHAIDIMTEIQTTAAILTGMFKSIKPLPDEIRNLRYPILAGGNNIISQADDVIYIVRQIKNNNRQGSGNQGNKREIQALLHQLDSNIECMSKNLGTISNTSIF